MATGTTGEAPRKPPHDPGWWVPPQFDDTVGTGPTTHKPDIRGGYRYPDVRPVAEPEPEPSA